MIASRALLRIISIPLATFFILVAAEPQLEPAAAASSFEIILEFDPTDDAVDPCVEPMAACGHDADLAAIMEAAASYWEEIIEDDHTMTIRYRWIAENLPSADVVTLDAAGRTTEGIVRVPAGRTYFYDPTPTEDEEFDMQPRLYRTVHPDEKIEAFQGAPVEVFEAGYIGLEDDDLDADLFGQMLHEIGHLLGLHTEVVEARPVPPCTEADPYYDIDPALGGGVPFALKAFEGSNGIDCAHLALGGITTCKTDPEQSATSDEPSTFPPLTVQECTSHQALLWVSEYPSSRSKPSIADIVAIATAAGWEEINMPRKYSLADSPQTWEDGNTWLGGRVPDAGDDVYIVNQEDNVEINSFEEDAVARNLTITSGNVLNIFSFPLFVERDVIMRDTGTRISVDLGAVLDPFRIEVGEGALLDVPFDGFVDSFYIDNNGEIRGADSTIDVVVLENRGLIRGNGGLLSFTSSSIDQPFDLDGNAVDAVLQALVGDLSFDGEITDPVLARIEVGPNHFITFADGWAQESSANPAHFLDLTGGAFEATINGFTTLNGRVHVDEIGRFTSDTELLQFARVEMSVGSSTTPGTGHDQLRFDEDVSLAGELVVDLLPGFEAHPNDRFALMTYGEHTGEFATATLPALDGGLTFLLDYGDGQLDLVVGFAGATPGAANCNGKATSAQANAHGGIANAAAFHGYASVQAFKDAISEFCED